MAQWCFRPKSPGETIREPVQGEFFATDAISDPGMALVREGIQTALDAGKPGQKVLVRVFVSGSDQAVAAPEVQPFLHTAWQHLRASGNGLRPDDLPTEGSGCSFLVFEDFGTTGLEGDPAEPFRPKDEGLNHFYHFFRAEGQSDKGQGDRGSWGVGKHVFLRASRISTVFGLTVRDSDRQRMLMGKSVLKSHWVSGHYCQDGYFGVPPSEQNQLVMPVTDEKTLNRFAKLFDLQRGNEPGLSLVAPWPDADISDNMITRAVLHDYFYPILAGQLEVIVETPTLQTVLDASTLIAEVVKLDADVAGDLKPLLELADWARGLTSDQKIRIGMPNPDYAWQWFEALLPAELLAGLREAYYRGDRLAIRVPVTVRRKKGPPQESYFDVYFVRDSAEQTGRPTFIREGIIITRVDSPRTRGVRAVVVAEDFPVAAFLRAAENPSHTEWQHVRLKNDYSFGYRKDLEFVKRSVHELVRLLTGAEKQEDPSLLADFFSLPAQPEEDEAVKTRRRQPGQKSGEEPPTTAPPPPPPQRFRIRPVEGGFAVVPGDEGAPPPAMLDIRVAYDTRRGNPLRKYNTADFRLDRPPIGLDPAPKGIDVLECKENRILAKIKDKDFVLHVVGFDKRRQVYVRAIPKEDGDGNTKT